MGMTIKAKLHYGYNLGDPHYGNGWEFTEVNEDGDPTMPWWDEYGDSLDEQAEEHLLKQAGIVQDDETPGYGDRLLEAHAALGVEFVHTGYEGCRTLLVATGSGQTASATVTTAIDPAAMAGTATEAMDQALTRALKVLGITPKQEQPRWLLTCYYG